MLLSVFIVWKATAVSAYVYVGVHVRMNAFELFVASAYIYYLSQQVTRARFVRCSAIEAAQH